MVPDLTKLVWEWEVSASCCEMASSCLRERGGEDNLTRPFQTHAGAGQRPREAAGKVPSSNSPPFRNAPSTNASGIWMFLLPFLQLQK